MTAGGLLLLTTVIRFIMLDRYPAPPSGDFGNYLTQVHIIEGNDVTGYGLRYPPAFFVLLAPLEYLLGPMLATKLAAAVVASSSCIPIFLLARRWADFYSAVAAVVLFTFSQAMAEMTAWGGSPNFLAITFFVFVLYFLDRAFARDGKLTVNSIAAGVFAGFVFETHHLTTVVLLATLGFFFVFMLIWQDRKGRIRTLRVLALMGVPGVLVGLPALPVYLRMQGGLSSSLGSYGPPSLHSLMGPGGAGYLTGANWIPWTAVFILGAGAIAFGYLSGRRDVKMRLLVASAFGPAILGVLVVKEAPGRVLSFLPVPLVMGFSMFIVGFERWTRRLEVQFKITKGLKRVFLSLFIADVLLMGAAGVQWMSYAVDWYHPIEQGDKVALDWVKENTPSDAVFATSGKLLAGHKEGDRLAWWIEGYSQRRTVMAGSEMFRLFEDELQSTRDMNRFFAGTNVAENGYMQVSEKYPLEYRGNPEIDVKTDKAYMPVAFLNDAVNRVVYGSNSSSPDQLNRTCVSMSRGSLETNSSDTSITMSAALSGDSFNITRETVLRKDQHVADIVFHIRPVGAVRLDQYILYVWCPHGARFTHISSPSSTTRLTVDNHWDPPIPMNISATATTGSLASVTYDEEDPIWFLPVLVYTFNADSSGTAIDFTISVDSTTGHHTDTPLAHYNGYEILRKYNVSYLFESLSMSMEVERFEQDAVHFQVVFRDSSVEIFKVISYGQ